MWPAQATSHSNTRVIKSIFFYFPPSSSSPFLFFNQRDPLVKRDPGEWECFEALEKRNDQEECRVCVYSTQRGFFFYSSGSCPHHNPKMSQPGETEEEVKPSLWRVSVCFHPVVLKEASQSLITDKEGPKRGRSIVLSSVPIEAQGRVLSQMRV